MKHQDRNQFNRAQRVRRDLALAIAAMFLLAAVTRTNGGDFVNLGFEDANLSNLFADAGHAHDLAPGWEWNIGGAGYTSDTLMYFDGPVLNGFGPGWAALLGVPNPYNFPIIGSYGLVLAPAYDGLHFAATSIRESGVVPVGTKSLQFLDYFYYSYSFAPPIEVKINGALVPLQNTLLSTTPLPQNTGLSIFAFRSRADISMYSGQQVSLEFTIPVVPMGLDDIQFSQLPIPEPSTWALLATGLGALVWSKRRRNAME